jgi:hypothetical protein
MNLDGLYDDLDGLYRVGTYLNELEERPPDG